MSILHQHQAELDNFVTGKRAEFTAKEAGALVPAGSVSALAAKQAGIGSAAEHYRHFRGWPYVAIRAIAQRVAAQPVYVARMGSQRPAGAKSPLLAHQLPARLKSAGERLEPLASHPLLAALDDPNSLMVRWGLMFSTVASLELTGRAFWWLSQDRFGKLSIWPVPVHWTEPAERGAWLVRPFGGPEGVTVPADSMAYFYLPDPSNPLGATSPLATQGLAVSADEAIQQAQYRAFRNGIHPGVMLTAGRLQDMPNFPGQRPVLTDTQRRQLIDSVKKYYAGAVNYDEPLILDGLIEKAERLTTSPREMDFLDSGRQTKSRIFQAFGVNPLIVGEIEGANRAQAVVAEESFCQNTVNPLCEILSQTMTAWLGEELCFWIEPCRAHDPEQSQREWETALRFGAATRNEYRRTVLNLPEDPRFEDVLVPAAMIPEGENADAEADE